MWTPTVHTTVHRKWDAGGHEGRSPWVPLSTVTTYETRYTVRQEVPTESFDLWLPGRLVAGQNGGYQCTTRRSVIIRHGLPPPYKERPRPDEKGERRNWGTDGNTPSVPKSVLVFMKVPSLRHQWWSSPVLFCVDLPPIKIQR